MPDLDAVGAVSHFGSDGRQARPANLACQFLCRWIFLQPVLRKVIAHARTARKHPLSVVKPVQRIEKHPRKTISRNASHRAQAAQRPRTHAHGEATHPRGTACRWERQPFVGVADQGDNFDSECVLQDPLVRFQHAILLSLSCNNSRRVASIPFVACLQQKRFHVRSPTIHHLGQDDNLAGRAPPRPLP